MVLGHKKAIFGVIVTAVPDTDIYGTNPCDFNRKASNYEAFRPTTGNN